MIKKIEMAAIGIFLAGVLALFTVQWAAAESLYEYYTSASTKELNSETTEMGRELKPLFSQASISARQQKIDFAEYFANLKKLVLYAGKLATYSEYEKDLRFARDNEVFRGLSESSTRQNSTVGNVDRKMFVEKKYGQMKKNVGEETDTYVDLIRLSLDACETSSGNDLSGFLDNRAYRDQVAVFKGSKTFRAYASKKGRFSQAWPGLASRISRQFSLWDPAPVSQDDPILSRKITGAI